MNLALAQTPTAPAQERGPTFRVAAIAVEGATLVGAAESQAVLAPYLNRDIGFEDLEAARAAVERLFRERGFRLVTVRIPTQETTTGAIRFQVVEPTLTEIKVTGNVNFSVANWQAGLPALRTGEQVDLDRVDRQLLLVNESGAKRGQVVFEALDTPDKLKAEIRAQDSPPASGIVFLDNTGNEQTGKLRYGVAWRHANLWDRDHQVNVQFISAPHERRAPNQVSLLPSDRVQIFGASYRIPLYAQAATLDATLGYSTVNSGVLPNLFSVSGRGTLAGVRYTRHLNRIDGWEPRWFIAQDYRDFNNRAVFSGVNFAPDIRLHPLSTGVSASRSGQGYNAGLNASFVTNIPGGDGGGKQDFAANRLGASSTYKLVRFGASYLAALGPAIVNATFDGQWTRDLLVAGEQFGAGGATSVRGFGERFISADAGVRFQLEVQSAPLLDPAANPGGNLRLVAFADGAYLTNNQPLVPQRSYLAIASVGVGLRAAWSKLTARLDAARPVHQETGQPYRSGFVHFSLAVGF